MSKCDHCYCIEHTKGLNGPKCKRGYSECCMCEDKKPAAKTATPDEFRDLLERIERERKPDPIPYWPPLPPQLPMPHSGYEIWVQTDTTTDMRFQNTFKTGGGG